jgi:sulfur-carrier protein
MAVVSVRGRLKALAGGEADHRVAGATVLEALRELERSQPAMRGWVLDERGAIRRHIHVFVNGDDAQQDTPVGEGDRIDVAQAISGGSR